MYETLRKADRGIARVEKGLVLAVVGVVLVTQVLGQGAKGPEEESLQEGSLLNYQISSKTNASITSFQVIRGRVNYSG